MQNVYALNLHLISFRRFLALATRVLIIALSAVYASVPSPCPPIPCGASAQSTREGALHMAAAAREVDAGMAE
jgi:hypothetical protein